MKMKANNKSWSLFIIMSLVLVFTFTGCGSASYDMAATTEEGYYEKSSSSESYDNSGYGYYDETAYDEMEMETEEAVSDITSNPNLTNKANVKLVYTANIYVQTLNYDESYAQIKEKVNSFGGYFESTEVSNGDYWSDGNYKNGSFKVRIPADKYSEFINEVGTSCHVVSLNESVEDIGQAYYEAESHIETLRIKEKRLHELLEKADTMTDIIELESALSETEYELEQYSNTLERYDGLVNYSTVYINLEQVTQYISGIDEEQGFFERIGQSIKNGAINFLEGLEDFLAWLGYNLITIIIIGAVIILAFRLHLGSFIKKVLGRGGSKSGDKPIKEDRKGKNNRKIFSRKNKEEEFIATDYDDLEYTKSDGSNTELKKPDQR